MVGINFGMNQSGLIDHDAGDSTPDLVVRMPSTGIADLPSSGLLGAIVLALGLMAGLGFVMERRQ